MIAPAATLAGCGSVGVGRESKKGWRARAGGVPRSKRFSSGGHKKRRTGGGGGAWRRGSAVVGYEAMDGLGMLQRTGLGRGGAETCGV